MKVGRRALSACRLLGQKLENLIPRKPPQTSQTHQGLPKVFSAVPSSVAGSTFVFSRTQVPKRHPEATSKVAQTFQFVGSLSGPGQVWIATGCYRLLQAATGCYRLPQAATGCHWGGGGLPFYSPFLTRFPSLFPVSPRFSKFIPRFSLALQLYSPVLPGYSWLSSSILLHSSSGSKFLPWFSLALQLYSQVLPCFLFDSPVLPGSPRFYRSSACQMYL